MESKNLRRLNDGVFKEIEGLNFSVGKKIVRLYTNKSLIDRDELEAIVAEYKRAIESYNQMARMAFKILNDSPTKEEGKNEQELALRYFQIRLERVSDRLNLCEEMFQKYNIPRLSEFGSLQDHVKAVESFMRVWKEEAEKERKKGCSTLNELLIRLNRRETKDETDSDALQTMSCVVDDILHRIWYELCLYFDIKAATVDEEEFRRKLQELKAVLGCLKVEEESAIIDNFLARVMRVEAELESGGENHGIAASTESELLHLIFREVLRFEIAFNCPDLPTMLISEMVLEMAKHLDSVFARKLERVSLKVTQLEIELNQIIGDGDLKRI